MSDQNDDSNLLSIAKSLGELEMARISIFGKNGNLTKLSKELKSSHGAHKKELGHRLNALKINLLNIYEAKKSELEKSHQKVDIKIEDIYAKPITIARLHPTTVTIAEITQYFSRLGYSVYDGPEIETDEFNFDKLNLPHDHPARDLQDTLYISEPESLLRTHTSSVETRCMTQENLPIRIIVPGKCYRNESVNASNNAIFYQLEGLFVDKGINMGHLKATLEGFVKFLYGDHIKTRFRCKYYPQVEPGAGMDIECQLCKGTGCIVCKYRGYIEALGAGMVHPQVLRKCGIDPTIYSGFAFGMGLDRLVMMKYGIKDIRTLYSGELVWKN
jgi:phenylalanyl-tRNA synthetase alpha chain